MKLSNVQTAIICLIVANIIWGATAPIVKWTLQDIDPFTFAFLRFFLSALIVLPFALKKLSVKREDISLLLFLSIIGLGLRFAYIVSGLKLAPSINELIIASTAPVFLLIGAVALFHEKTTKKLLIGMFLSFLGVLVIVLQPLLVSGLNLSFMGNMFFVMHMCLGVVYVLLLKELTPRYHIITLLFWGFAIAALTMLPFAGYEMSTSGFAIEFTPTVIIGLSFAIFFSTLLAHYLNAYGIKYIRASEVGLFSYVDPFIGVAIAGPLLGEHITSYYLIGAIFVFLGIFIAENRLHYHPFHLLKPKLAEEKLPTKG